MAYHRYIFTEPEKEALSNERLDIRLLYISKSRYDRNWQSILHSHAFAELFYVIHGTGVFQTENDSFPVTEDDLVLINPNVTHTEFSHGENALEYIVLGLDGISFRSSNNTFLPYTICNLRSNRKEMLFYTQTLLQELREKKENYINICQNLLEILIQLVDRNTIATPNLSTTDKLSRECHFIEQYLDEHFAEDINLDTLSELTYMNKYYMVHVFTRYKGVSPINYLINRRIDEANTTECGYYGATKLLLEYGADCNFQEDYMKQNGLLALRFYENDAAAKTLQLLLDYGTDLDIKQSDNKSGREELKNFQKDYMNVKDKVPNYDEIVEIIDRLEI